jgi:hypothetical protein
VIRRFQIEDLIVQDATGVVFRAIDSETGKTVAVRRFFPFGADGGGLQADEQVAYNIALERLSGLSHPALRSVICGGCDPVDGMPFIATEWIEGTSLLPIIDNQGPITPEVATELLTQALEVSELLSHVLAEEAVWVETDLQTIVFGNEDTGRRFTFWISPLKWLGSGEQPRGLESIINLTEEIMGWKGRAVADEEGRGLGKWLHWLRAAAPTTSLHQARESLAASIGAQPPAPAKTLVDQASLPPAKNFRKAPPRIMMWVNIVLILGCAGLGYWVWQRKLPKETIVVSIATEPEPVETASAKPARKLTNIAEITSGAVETPPPAAAAAPAPPPTKKAAPAPKAAPPPIAWNNNKALVRSKGKPVVIEGKVVEIGPSLQKDFVVLYFAISADNNAARILIPTKGAPENLTLAALQPLLDKTIRVSGTLLIHTEPNVERPNITIKDRAAITVP